jgi:hypothetical protein
MHLEFVGYCSDCIITGQVELTAPRLTDMLNTVETIQLTDVALESLADGRRVTVPTYSLRRDELYAVKATGPRGSKALRIITIPHRVQAQIGPYNVLGRLNAAPGTEPIQSLEQRGVMLPLTDATIAYVVGGILEVRDAATVVINRDLLAWVRQTDPEPEESLATPMVRSYSDVAG